MDVIIPILHTNELWESNLVSIYREIPVNRLLISNGGCIDDSITIVKKFPRVEVFDHKEYTSLGYCIRKLIESVETEWFIYLHSDIYLPEKWFDIMKKHCAEYDWFGCPQRVTALIEYSNTDKVLGIERPYAGSQMGRKKAFDKYLHTVDDDYVYRQEDFVFADIVERAGFKEGRIHDTFHYHQHIHKESPYARKYKNISFEVEWSKEEIIRSSTMQIKGIIKYLKPSTYHANWLKSYFFILIEHQKLDYKEIKKLITETNKEWFRYIKFWKIRLLYNFQKMTVFIKNCLKSVLHV
ncbi:hypothetical protein ACFL6D_01360 [Spirochaetota bacterium]